MVPHEVDARRRHQHRQLLHELKPGHHEVLLAADDPLHRVANLAVVSLDEPTERQRSACTVAAQPLEAGAIVGVQMGAAVQREPFEERLMAAVTPIELTVLSRPH